jgi:Uma2 family endonuclease
LLRIQYGEAAEAYLRSLPLEHFMEAIGQGTQRKITLVSLELVRARRSDVQVFNELLVQYRLRRRKPGQVVPDNMVIVWPEPIKASGSYDVPFQPVGPFWVLEYVSQYSKRKDYEESFIKYERDLKVPYYLLFYPDNQEMTLYHHTSRRYATVQPNDQGRCAIPELEMEVGLLDGWVRYWYQDELLPLPADLQRQLEEAIRRAEVEARRAEEEHQARLAAEQEVARLREQLEQLRSRRRGNS